LLGGPDFAETLSFLLGFAVDDDDFAAAGFFTDDFEWEAGRVAMG
jgi:hypothetical protein